MKTIIFMTGILIIIIGILFVVGIFWFIIGDEADNQKEKEDCYKIVGCEKWRCLADWTGSYIHERNYLLREQNCLLRGK